jgi:SAM-dependent methyltransferase
MGMTEDDAFLFLRNNPDRDDIVRHCYYDDPVSVAAQRFFESPEWKAVLKKLPHRAGMRALDIGAGRGIGSYALVKSGFVVVALEPDPSTLLGAKAISQLGREVDLRFPIVSGFGEHLPFRDETFDVVYGRAILHHAANLKMFCREISRILKTRGRLVMTREHVVSKKEDIPDFIKEHLAIFGHDHENAFLLSEYRDAIASSGIRLDRVVGPFESAINYYPLTCDGFANKVSELFGKVMPTGAARRVSRSRIARTIAGIYLSRRSNDPGRLFSFFGTKP